MSVSSMFTQGYMDEPAAVTINVHSSASLLVKVASDTALSAVLGLPPGFVAALVGDALLEAVVGLQAAFAAIVATDAPLQATIVPGAGIAAVLACEE